MSLRDRLKPNLGPQKQFDHSHKIIAQELDSYSNDNGRFYITPSGLHVPSATTVLGHTEDKSYLDDWRNRIGEDQANKITAQSARRGTVLHDMCEKYLLGDPNYLGNPTPVYLSLFKQIKPLLDRHVSKVYGTEIALWSDHLRVGGRSDGIVEFDGIPSVIDYKNARYVKQKEDIESYWKQTCIYGMCAYEDYSLEIKQLIILMAVEGREDEGLIYREKIGDWMKPTIATIRKYHSQTK